MTKTFANPQEEASQFGNSLNLNALQNDAQTADLEKAFQDYKAELEAVLAQQNRTETSHEKLIDSLAENQLQLQKNQAILQQQITSPPEPPPADIFGMILSNVPLLAAVIALLLAICAVFRGNSQTERLRAKDKEIAELKKQVSSVSDEVKILRAKIPVMPIDTAPPRRPTPQNDFFAETALPRSNYQPLPARPTAAPAPVPPENLRESKEKIFLRDLNEFLAAAHSSNLRQLRLDFTKKYPVKAFSCANAEERMGNPSVAPKFVTTASTQGGDFWAYKPDDVYLVVPSTNSYNDNLHLERAMREVFDSNFVEGNTYDNIVVEKAAVFAEGWKQLKKGRLRLS